MFEKEPRDDRTGWEREYEGMPANDVDTVLAVVLATDFADVDSKADTLPAPPVKCTGFRCDAEGTIDSGDFGMLCERHYAIASDSAGT